MKVASVGPLGKPLVRPLGTSCRSLGSSWGPLWPLMGRLQSTLRRRGAYALTRAHAGLTHPFTGNPMAMAPDPARAPGNRGPAWESM
eukprot:7360923-Pyramimonas_sp.AAC.1